MPDHCPHTMLTFDGSFDGSLHSWDAIRQKSLWFQPSYGIVQDLNRYTSV